MQYLALSLRTNSIYFTYYNFVFFFPMILKGFTEQRLTAANIKKECQTYILVVRLKVDTAHQKYRY